MTSESKYTLPFVHLRVHSAYSLGLGLSTPRDLCAQAARFGYREMALTDTDGTYGFVEFHRAARDFGIKPIYGSSLTLGWERPAGAAGQDGCGLLLLALDRGGLKNLCAVTSVAATRRLLGQDLDTTDLEGRSAGLVCLLNLPKSRPDLIGAESESEHGLRLLRFLKSLFNERVFLEIQASETVSAPRSWITAAGEMDVRSILTADVRFAGQKQFRLGAAPKDRIDESGDEYGGLADVFDDRYRLKTAAEMSAYHAVDPDAYTNASMIAALVQPDVLETLDRPVAGRSVLSLFENGGEAKNRLAEKLELEFEREFPLGGGGDPAARDNYKKILDREIEFFTSDDLAESCIKFAEVMSLLRQWNIRLGPATGLRLQSFCAYLLGITCFNPYEVDEAFQPHFSGRPRQHRVLDLQVAADDRPATVTALNKFFFDYGIGYVPTVDHVTPARALRTAAQEMKRPEADYQEVLRAATDFPGVSLMDLCNENRSIGRLYKRSALVRELVSRAAAKEGLPCGFIRSKRTLIVSPRPLREFLGYTVNPETGDLFFQATRDAFPTNSIYRIDISTLTALSVISEAEAYTEDPSLSIGGWSDAAFDSPEVFGHIEKNDVDGVYLLEAPLTRRLAASFDLKSFNELTDFLALMRYRGGDLSFSARVEAYLTAEAKSEAAESSVSFLLNDTRGWILYDDQLRRIISALTGAGGAESGRLLRRFRGYDPGDLAALRNEFMGLTVETELPMEDAKKWFNRILFNARKTLVRQRIIADALIVGRLLWYKHHRRGAFFTGLLNAHSGNDSKRKVYLGIAEAEGLLLAPHVNFSERGYSYENGLIRPPLASIKDLSETAIRGILRERRRDKFKDLDDFVCRMGSECINNKEVETLVRERAIDPGKPVSPRNEAPPEGRSPEPTPRRAVRRNDVPQLELSLGDKSTSGAGRAAAKPPGDTPPIEVPSTEKDGNKRGYHHVVPSLKEFYPHPTASPVELAGRVRNLHVLETSSGIKTRFFVLFDSKSSVRVFQPVERIGREGEPLADGSHVVVRGKVSTRDGKKVCDATEVIAVEGGAHSDGETTPDESAGGDP